MTAAAAAAAADEDELTTSIQCDAPGCGKWYDADDIDDLALDIHQIVSQYEVWHCEHCKCRRLCELSCVMHRLRVYQ